MRALLPHSLVVFFTLFGTLVINSWAAPEGPAAQRLLDETLRAERAEPLRLIWQSGVPGSGAYRRLEIAGGRAALEQCGEGCKPVGAAITLSSGERAQLLSR